MSFRPLLRKSFSSNGANTPTNTHESHSHSQSTNLSPSSSSIHLNATTPPALTSANSSSHISIQLPSADAWETGARDQREAKEPRESRRQSGSMEHKPHHSALATGGSGHFPRTRTNSSSHGDGRYRRKVGFEAFEAGPEALFAYTCQAKSEGYKRSRNTRVFAVAVSADESGEDALDWLMTELVEDGDEIVAIRIIEMDEGERHDPEAQDVFREDAHQLLTNVLGKNNEADDRRISVVVEFVAGKTTDMLLKMIALYRPDSLVVGTKGTRSKLQTWGKALGAPGMGSVSRFAVSHSPIPVIVVRPERKVKKTLEKRQNNPKRGQYAALLGTEGLSLSRSRSRGSIGGMSDKE